MSDEKREHPRIKTAALISYAEFNALHLLKNLGMGKTIDISRNGVRLSTNTPIPIPTVLTLDLAIEERIIHVTGRVVHVREVDENRYEHGIQIQEISEEDKVALEEYLSQRDEDDAK